MHLSELNIYPIKSLKGIPLKSSIVEDRGLQFDRRWMLINENNEFMTQRGWPKMATLAVEIVGDGLRVSENAENKHVIPYAPDNGTKANVKIWKNRCKANVYDAAINEWFSDVLKEPCQLVLMPEETTRKIPHHYAVHSGDRVSFADGYPFLLIGEGSLAELNSRLEKPLPMNRFRPNFVVSGSDAFAEDAWKKIKIGETVFHVVKPCGRCIITTTDQEKGIRPNNEPLKTLAAYRTGKIGKKNKILFGQNLIADKAGAVVKVGDKIEILEIKKS